MKSVFAFLCLFIASANAATWISDGTPENTQFVHDTLAVDGDIIQLPIGTFIWTTRVTLTKAITLDGWGIGNTIIRDNVQSGQFLTFSIRPALVSRLTEIEFQNGGRSTVAVAPNGLFKVTGNNLDGGQFRMDNCKWVDVNGTIVFQTVLGVVDHCQFTFDAAPQITVYDSAWNGGVWGDASQVAPSNFGSDQFLFLEDNIAEATGNRNFTDSYGGGRFVVRRNLFVDTGITNHGTEGQRSRGVRAIEVYENDFLRVDSLDQVILNSRGGVLLFHDNHTIGYSAPNAILNAYRTTVNSSIWHLADGTGEYDNNANGQLIHALDQPGRSRGGLITGGVPPVHPWPAGQNDQITEPCYSWDNTRTEDSAPINLNSGASVIRVGEHYFNGTPMPSYTPYVYPHPLTNETPSPTPTPTPSPSPTATQSPSPSPTPPQCIVPDFIGHHLNEAEEIWKAAGFSTEPTMLGKPGHIIWSQSLSPGYTGDCNLTEILVVAP